MTSSPFDNLPTPSPARRRAETSAQVREWLDGALDRLRDNVVATDNIGEIRARLERLRAATGWDGE